MVLSVRKHFLFGGVIVNKKFKQNISNVDSKHKRTKLLPLSEHHKEKKMRHKEAHERINFSIDVFSDDHKATSD